MRAYTGGKHGMGKRFAILIGAAAAGVMALGALALGAQTGAAGGAPHLKLSGHKKQIGPPCTDRCGVPRAVSVIASCGEVSGPTVSSLKDPGVPPANLPDLGCHLSAEGKVMGDKLRPGLQAHVDVPGPHVQCEADQVSSFHCHWASGMSVLMELELREKTRQQVRNALSDGQKVRATVTVEARNAGKVATAKRTITLATHHIK